jgi:hypothetical protein
MVNQFGTGLKVQRPRLEVNTKKGAEGKYMAGEKILYPVVV